MSDKPQRKITWLWRNDQHGYGELRLSTLMPNVSGSERDQGRWTHEDYFALPLKGPRGRVWSLALLVSGVGIAEEYVVDLVGFSCTCGEFFRRGDCAHLRGVNQLDHHGRL